MTSYNAEVKKAMATQSSVLAWRIPGTGKPSGLLSMGLHRVRHDWSDLAAAAAAAMLRIKFNLLNMISIMFYGIELVYWSSNFVFFSPTDFPATLDYFVI